MMQILLQVIKQNIRVLKDQFKSHESTSNIGLKE